jgi:hypothetical protein
MFWASILGRGDPALAQERRKLVLASVASQCIVSEELRDNESPPPEAFVVVFGDGTARARCMMTKTANAETCVES